MNFQLPTFNVQLSTEDAYPRTLFIKRWMLKVERWTLAFLFLVSAATASARINVVTLPGRDSTQLTIYNSVDLTMVRETRKLTFRKGVNRLEFSWANTLIDPTSVEFRAVTHADGVEVLDASFPPRVANTLEWRIQSEIAGEVEVEIRYFTSGISWAADYVGEAARNEKTMDLSGYVRVNNHSGEDYEHAQIRLIVGTVRLVEQVAELARRGARDKSGPMTRTLSELSDVKRIYGVTCIDMREKPKARARSLRNARRS